MYLSSSSCHDQSWYLSTQEDSIKYKKIFRLNFLFVFLLIIVWRDNKHWKHVLNSNIRILILIMNDNQTIRYLLLYFIHCDYITIQNITSFLVIYNKGMIVWGIKSKLQDWHDMINLLFVTWLIGLHKLSCLQRMRSFGQRNICQHATDFMQHNHD